jgi:NAD(P)-dependent dehydrogenase (short-subunit alcohol dehydrogenase family)
MGSARALAQQLAAHGGDIILHGRDRDRLAATAEQISRQLDRPKPATVLADFADLAQVRGVSKQVADLTDRLDVLVSNAGIGAGEPDGRDRQVSADGYELRFAVNYLSLDLTGAPDPA